MEKKDTKIIFHFRRNLPVKRLYHLTTIAYRPPSILLGSSAILNHAAVSAEKEETFKNAQTSHYDQDDTNVQEYREYKKHSLSNGLEFSYKKSSIATRQVPSIIPRKSVLSKTFSFLRFHRRSKNIPPLPPPRFYHNRSINNINFEPPPNSDKISQEKLLRIPEHIGKPNHLYRDPLNQSSPIHICPKCGWHFRQNMPQILVPPLPLPRLNNNPPNHNIPNRRLICGNRILLTSDTIVNFVSCMYPLNFALYHFSSPNDINDIIDFSSVTDSSLEENDDESEENYKRKKNSRKRRVRKSLIVTFYSILCPCALLYWPLKLIEAIYKAARRKLTAMKIALDNFQKQNSGICVLNGVKSGKLK
ncbi:unnamed protein product [Gordionus sp. m RMFG-2023]